MELSSHSTVNPTVDELPILSDLCMKAMAKNPEHRFPSAKDFAMALGEFLHESQKTAVAASGEIVAAQLDGDQIKMGHSEFETITHELTHGTRWQASTSKVIRSRRLWRVFGGLSVGIAVCLFLAIGSWPSFIRQGSTTTKASGSEVLPTGNSPTKNLPNLPPKKDNLKPGEIYILKYGTPQIATRFRWIPPGQFTRGTEVGREDERPSRRITITKGFWIAETECTQAQWRAITKSNPDPSRFKGDNLPVDSVSAGDADEFCKAVAKVTDVPIRLPSEAEWEYACGAGMTTHYHSGDGEESLKRSGWYNGNSDSKTHPVGQLEANAWGLKDMHGNVREWCLDGYDKDYYALTLALDPICTNNRTSYRVARGGSWNDYGTRTCVRYSDPPFNRLDYMGLRGCDPAGAQFSGLFCGIRCFVSRESRWRPSVPKLWISAESPSRPRKAGFEPLSGFRIPFGIVGRWRIGCSL